VTASIIWFPYLFLLRSNVTNHGRQSRPVNSVVYAQHVSELMGFKSPFGGSV
jgi:hypothetical protein